MNIASEFIPCSPDELKPLMDGGTLAVYSVARPLTADAPVERSLLLATFTFASPAFGPAADGLESPAFTMNPIAASNAGTPGFARARKADGTVIADFSAGPGDREIKFSEVSFSQGAPVEVTAFRFIADGGWPGATGILRHASTRRLRNAPNVTSCVRFRRCAVGDSCELPDMENQP